LNIPSFLSLGAYISTNQEKYKPLSVIHRVYWVIWFIGLLSSLLIGFVAFIGFIVFTDAIKVIPFIAK